MVQVSSGVKHRIGASLAREHQVFVEGRLKGAGVGDGQHCGGGLDVIRDAHAGLGLALDGKAVVQVAAHAKVEVPVAGLDLVLDVHRQFLHVRVAEVDVFAAAAGQIVRGVKATGRSSRLRWLHSRPRGNRT